MITAVRAQTQSSLLTIACIPPGKHEPYKYKQFQGNHHCASSCQLYPLLGSPAAAAACHTHYLDIHRLLQWHQDDITMQELKGVALGEATFARLRLVFDLFQFLRRHINTASSVAQLNSPTTTRDFFTPNTASLSLYLSPSG